ncbi:histidine acid phosphatase family protein [Abeliophyllum distichum]|uniref:Histidine acid phosphatase family protein n=1 Tax=Abeliophyllum distichum TaxID=126358 RepID=A0ABD1UNX2_9LAMI
MLKNENNFLTGLTLLLLIFFIAKINSNAEQNFDVRQHLSTVTRYHVAKEISEDSFVPSNINDQCTPIHLNLVASRKSQEPFVAKLKEPVLNEITQELVKRLGLNFTRQDISSLWFFVQTEGLVPGSYEMARLGFAHLETLLPFSCLIGLFLDGSELELILREQPLQLHPKPPQKRIWRGSTVAHFAGNNMLVLYSCPANNSSKYFVQVLHNEHPTPMPVCENSDFCLFEVFQPLLI